MGGNIYGHYRCIYLTTVTDVFGQKTIEFGEKNAKLGLLRRSRSFKVNEVGINRKPVGLCDFILVINSNSYRFGIIAAYCSNFEHFLFLSHRLGGGGRNNVVCSFWTHWKARSGLPISDNWTFFDRYYGWGATGENRSKTGDFAPTRSAWHAKFQVEGDVPHQ